MSKTGLWTRPNGSSLARANKLFMPEKTGNVRSAGALPHGASFRPLRSPIAGRWMLLTPDRGLEAWRGGEEGEGRK